MNVQRTSIRVDRSGGELFEPCAGLEETELREASLLFKFSPTQAPRIELRLYAKPALIEIVGGGVKLGYEFDLTGVDRTGAPEHSGTLLGSGESVDAAVVDAALAIGANPIVEILIAQKDLAAEFYELCPQLRAIIESMEMAASLADGAPPARADFRL